MWRKMLRLGLVVPFALSLVFAANGQAIGEDHTAAVKEKNRVDMANVHTLLQEDASIRNDNAALNLLYDYVYSISDLTIPSGVASISDTVTVTDAVVVGTVTIDYDWDTDSYPGEGSFKVTSPAGTQLTIGAGQTDGHYTIALAGFAGEDLVGDWIFSVYDTYSDGGHTFTGATMNVDEPLAVPEINLSDDALYFGILPVGLFNEMTLTINNTGGGALTVSNIAADDGNFFLGDVSASVPAFGSVDISVGYEPSVAGDHTANLVFTSDDAGSPDTVTLSGTAVLPITMGGPDAYGYTWTSSLDAAGPTYAWIDTVGATDAIIANGDDYRGTIDLPFTFRFYGNLYTQITATTNGWIGMGPSTSYSSSYWTNTTLPSSTLPDNIIAPLWDDFKAGDSPGSTSSAHGTIQHKTLGTEPNRQFVVIFDEIVRGTYDTDYFSFEVILDEATSDITIQYLDVTGNSSADNGVGATIGLENSDASDALLFEYNGDPQLVYDEMAIHFISPPPPALPNMVLDVMSLDFGTVVAGGSATADVEITNNGSGDLVVSGATIAAPFSTGYSGTIPENTSAVATISFDPSSAGSFAETLTFTVTGDYTGDDAVALMGSAYPADFVLEGFENGFLPFGWSSIDVDGGSAFNDDLSYIDPHTGDVGAEAMGCADDYLITPSLSVPAGFADFTFWHGQESTTKENSFEVMVSVTGTEIADFVQIADFPLVNPPEADAWSMESIDLSAYAGQDIFVAIHVYYSESAYYGFGFDDFIMPPLTPSTNTLFFSEYMEGSSNNKGLEIYNGTGATANLDEYQIAQAVNGGGWAYYHAFPAEATLENGDVWLIVTDAAFAGMQDMADEILGYPSVVHHNGDDARALVHIVGTDTTFLDIIGDPNADPGSGWMVAGVDAATANHNLVRKSEIVSGNTDWLASAGTHADTSEWIVMDQDFWYGMGYHNEDYPLPGESCELAFEYGAVNDEPATGSIESYGANWYSFTNDGSYDNVIVSLCGSDFDTKIEVWESCDSATYIAYNDDACGTQSEVDLAELPAGDYLVKVYGYSSSYGDYILTITGTNGMPDFVVSSMEYYGQDTLDVVVTNMGEADSPGYFGTDYHGLFVDGDYLGYIAESGIALMAGESFTYTITGLGYDFLGSGMHEVAFAADVDDDVIEFDETNNNDTLMIDVLVPPATPRHLMAMASAEQIDLTWDPAPEESYELPAPLVGISERKTKNSVEDPVVLQKWAEINAQNASLRETGDDCTDPYLVTALPFDDTSSTVGFTNSFTYGNGNDVVYQVTVAADGYLYANTCGGSAGDTKLQIYAADCVTELAFNDDACSVRSEVMTAVTAGNYLVVVDGYYAGDVDYTLNISYSTELLAPDLTVSDMWMEDDAVYAELSNIGSIDITSSSLSCRWYVDGEYIGYVYPRALEVGGSDTLALTGFSYANVGPGEFQVNMIADYWNSLDEGDETNNEDSLTVTIEEPAYIPTFNIYRDEVMVAGAVEPIDFAFHGGYVDWGLVAGDYCYTVTQIMPDLSESAASNEACASITPNPPVGLSLMVNPDASASLNWMAPMPAGEIGYDDGSAESWMWVGGPSSTDHMMALRFNAPVGEFNISNIAVFGLGDEPSVFENLFIVGGDGSGMPDMANILFTAPAVNMHGTFDTGAEWTIVPAGVASTNSEFFVIAQWPEGSEIGPFVGTDDDVVSDRSYWSNDGGTGWNAWAGMFMIHAFVEVGGEIVAVGPTEPVIRNISSVDVPALVNTTVEAPELGLIPNERSFLGTFKVHRGTEPGVYDSVLVADLNTTMFMDAPELGESEYFYAVSANYDEGDSPFSNEVSYFPEALAWIDLDIDFDAMFVDLEYGDVYGSAGFDLMSIGLDTLDYEIEYHAPMGRVVSRNIGGSSMFSTDMPPMPGSTVDVAVYLYNTSDDTEWLDSASVSWPAGITVNSTTDFVVIDDATHYLATNNAIGDGATVEWWNHDGSYGNIYGDETAMSVMNISVDAAYTGDIYFDYFILGDIWGADPHEVSGSFVFMLPAFVVDIEPDENLLLADSTDAIVLHVDVVEYEPGYYPGFISIYSNAVNAPEEIIFPFNVKLAPPMGALAGTVTSSYDGSNIEGAFVVALDTMNWEEFYTETMADGSYLLDLPVGNYEVGIGHHDYFPVEVTVDIAMDVTTPLDAVLDANVMAPIDLSANENGGVYLSWDMPMMEFPIFYHDGVPTNGFFQLLGQAYGTVFDLTMFDGASIEYLDFVHYGWGAGGLFDYNVHIIDWSDFSTVDVITGLTTEFDAAAAPVLEFGIDLGGLDGIAQVGIFIEPLSGAADDAYPDLSTDGTFPAIPGTSFIIDLAAIDASGDISVNNPTIGDFMLNLWIMAEDGAPLVAAPVIGDDNSGRDTNPITAQDPSAKGGITGWTGIGLPMEDQGLRSEFTNFNVYSNVEGGGWSLIGTSDSLGYFDDSVLPDQIVDYTVSAVFDIAESATSDTVSIHYVSTENVGLPTSYALEQNYPNPFNPITFIRYQLPEVTDVKIVIYNVLGQKVATLVDQNMSAGYHNISWSGLNQSGGPVSSGVYLYRIETDNFTDVKKLMFLK